MLRAGMDPLDAILGFVVAAAAAAALTPVTARFARRVGAVDEPRERGLSQRTTPLLGGLAILAGVLLASALFLRWNEPLRGIMVGAVVVTLVGALDDRWELPALVKLIGMTVAAVIPVAAGVTVGNVTIPFVGAIDFGNFGAPLTVIGLIAVMNVVNFSDGIDGLAAGVCAIAGVTFAIIAFDLGRNGAGVLAAITGAPRRASCSGTSTRRRCSWATPARCLLGLLLGCIAVQGSVKTNAILALIFPLIVLTVPFLDTTFVVLKRMKYRRPVYSADRWHLHHRLSQHRLQPAAHGRCTCTPGR